MRLAKIVLFLFIASASFSSADSLNFSYSRLSGCQCDTAELKAIVNNAQPETRTYNLSVQDLSNGVLSYFIVPSLEVESGKKGEAALLVTPHCDALPGNYSFAVLAIAGNDTLSKTLQYRVLECHSLWLDAASTPGGVCAGETESFKISLFNRGNFSEAGTIATSLDFSNSSVPVHNFSLSPGRSKNFSFDVFVPEGTRPQNTSFKIRASSQYTYRDLSPVLQVKDCCGLTVNVTSIIEAQIGETTTVQVGFENTGKYDENYSIQLACPKFVSADRAFIEVPKGKTRFFNLAASPSPEDYYKVFPCIIRGISKRCNKASAVPPIINVSNFYNARLSSLNLENNSFRACRGEKAVAQFGLYNTGRPANFSPNAYGLPAGTVSSDKQFFYADQFSNNYFSFSIDTSQLSLGNHGVVFAADAPGYSANKSYLLTIDNKKCCGLTINVSSIIDAAAGGSVQVPVSFENTGSFDDAYRLSLQCPEFASLNASSLAVKAGAVEYALLVVSPNSSVSGKFPCIIRGYSDACQRASAVPPIINVTASAEPSATPSIVPSPEPTATPPAIPPATPVASSAAPQANPYLSAIAIIIVAAIVAVAVFFRGKLPF